MFIHDGPYADAVLRFTISFELDFPKSSPILKFGPDIYHRECIILAVADPVAMVDPKTLVWSPRNALARWQYVIKHFD